MCVLASGRNVTENFTMMFQLGFFLHVGIFINQTYIDPWCQLNPILQGSLDPFWSHQKPSMMQSFATYLNWVSHLATLVLSSMILYLIASDDGTRCFGKGEGALGTEGTWLLSLATA